MLVAVAAAVRCDGSPAPSDTTVVAELRPSALDEELRSLADRVRAELAAGVDASLLCAVDDADDDPPHGLSVAYRFARRAPPAPPEVELWLTRPDGGEIRLRQPLSMQSPVAATKLAELLRRLTVAWAESRAALAAAREAAPPDQPVRIAVSYADDPGHDAVTWLRASLAARALPTVEPEVAAALFAWTPVVDRDCAELDAGCFSRLAADLGVSIVAFGRDEPPMTRGKDEGPRLRLLSLGPGPEVKQVGRPDVEITPELIDGMVGELVGEVTDGQAPPSTSESDGSPWVAATVIGPPVALAAAAAVIAVVGGSGSVALVLALPYTPDVPSRDLAWNTGRWLAASSAAGALVTLTSLTAAGATALGWYLLTPPASATAEPLGPDGA